MKKKRSHAEIEEPEEGPTIDQSNSEGNQPEQEQEEQEHSKQKQKQKQKHHHHHNHQQEHGQQQHQTNQHQFEPEGDSVQQEQPMLNFRHKKSKQVYSRVSVDPTRRYSQPDERESWGPNVKGKKFRKEKGKKKRCPNAGVRIDGSVKSVRLDA